MKIINRFGRIVSVPKEQGEKMIKRKEATLYVEEKVVVEEKKPKAVKKKISTKKK